METVFQDARCRVRVISQRMRLLVLLGVVLVLAGVCWIWFAPELPTGLLSELGIAGKVSGGAPTWETRLLGLAVTALPSGLLIYALLQARTLFAEYAAGGFFSWKAACRLRRIAWAICSLAFVGPLTRTLLVLVLTLNNPPGQRWLSIGVSFNDYCAVMVGGLLLAIAWVMVEATRISEENGEFV